MSRSAASLAYRRTRTWRQARWRGVWKAFRQAALNIVALIGFGAWLAFLLHLAGVK